FFQAEDGLRDFHVTGVQTCALPIFLGVSIPVGGVWRGGFRADGPLASGVSVTGSLERMDVVLPGGSPPPPHIAIEGIWRNEPGRSGERGVGEVWRGQSRAGE